MQPKSPKWLDDISAAAAYIADETTGIDLAGYLADRRLRFAVERNFLIIGEALLRLERADPRIVASISDHRRIIGFRNRLAHAYYEIDQEQVWSIIHDFLPRLRREVDALLMAVEDDLLDPED